MSRSPLRRRRRRESGLQETERAMSPWFRFELEDDSTEVLQRLSAIDAFPGEVELRTSSTRLSGQLCAYEHCLSTPPGYTVRHGMFITDDDGRVHDVDFDDLLAFRFRLDEDISTDALRATWNALVDDLPLLGLHPATGELRTGIAVGFDVEELRPLTDRDGSWVHVLPVPLEALTPRRCGRWSACPCTGRRGRCTRTGFTAGSTTATSTPTPRPRCAPSPSSSTSTRNPLAHPRHPGVRPPTPHRRAHPAVVRRRPAAVPATQGRHHRHPRRSRRRPNRWPAT